MYTDPVLFTDAEALVINYLREKLVNVPVYSRVPNAATKEFIRVKRLGGMADTIVTDRPRIDIECWSDSQEHAADLYAKARAYVRAMAGVRGGTTVYRVVEVGGPQWLPDTSTGQPRYSFAVEFSTRGTRME